MASQTGSRGIKRRHRHRAKRYNPYASSGRRTVSKLRRTLHHLRVHPNSGQHREYVKRAARTDLKKAYTQLGPWAFAMLEAHGLWQT